MYIYRSHTRQTVLHAETEGYNIIRGTRPFVNVVQPGPADDGFELIAFYNVTCKGRRRNVTKCRLQSCPTGQTAAGFRSVVVVVAVV